MRKMWSEDLRWSSGNIIFGLLVHGISRDFHHDNLICLDATEYLPRSPSAILSIKSSHPILRGDWTIGILSKNCLALPRPFPHLDIHFSGLQPFLHWIFIASLDQPKAWIAPSPSWGNQRDFLTQTPSPIFGHQPKLSHEQYSLSDMKTIHVGVAPVNSDYCERCCDGMMLSAWKASPILTERNQRYVISCLRTTFKRIGRGEVFARIQYRSPLAPWAAESDQQPKPKLWCTVNQMTQKKKMHEGLDRLIS
jgi:hypothetical protein